MTDNDAHDMTDNVDAHTVDGFGHEWSRFTQKDVSVDELKRSFDLYFRVFPWSELPPSAEGFDAGCGSGRWAAFVAPRVGTLHCVDASIAALEVAKRNLEHSPNVRFYSASVQSMPFPDASMDFGYSLGVLHHIPDTQAGLSACAKKLKRGAPFLCYLYYALDNRPRWFRRLWLISDGARRAISALPTGPRSVIADCIACGVYFPLARAARYAEDLGARVDHLPLSAYRRASFYTMRTDALDRFGTRLEQRFTKDAIQQMMERAGLERVTFSDQLPYWCAVGWKA